MSASAALAVMGHIRGANGDQGMDNGVKGG